MSHHTTNTHSAGGLEGLALGAPIGGGSAPSNTATGLVSSTTGSAPVGTTGLTGSSHQHGTGVGSDLTDSHSHSHGTGVGSGLTGATSNSTQPGAYDSNALNSTSGEAGIGGGRGGPTAFESDASRVGTTGGAGDHGHVGHSHGSHSHGSHGITGSTGTGAGDDKAAIKALTGAGHHDQSRVGQYDSGATTGTHGSHGHGLAAAGTGAGLAGVGAGAAGLASHGHRGGEVDDSVTGREHFKSPVGEQTAGDVPRAATLTSSGAGADHGVGSGHGVGATTGAPVASGGSGFGAGSLAGAGAAGVGAGAVGAGAAHHGHSTHDKNPVKELKNELKEHQSAPGYDKAEHHTETEGPHGLVWHEGKYVHKRELEGKGSTGVPLK